MMRMIERLRLWWRNNRTGIEDAVEGILEALDRLSLNIIRLMFLGFILNIVVTNCYPEFPERFPFIYGWFDGWLQLGEFAVKSAVKLIYSIFSGKLAFFWPEYKQAWDELVQQFVNWIGTIRL